MNEENKEEKVKIKSEANIEEQLNMEKIKVDERALRELYVGKLDNINREKGILMNQSLQNEQILKQLSPETQKEITKLNVKMNYFFDKTEPDRIKFLNKSLFEMKKESPEDYDKFFEMAGVTLYTAAVSSDIYSEEFF